MNGTIDAAVPVLRVASVARSMAWYGDVLGFSADPAGPSDDPAFAILRRDGVELMLQRVRAGVGEPRSAATAGGGWDVWARVPRRPEPPERPSRQADRPEGGPKEGMTP